MMSRMFVNFYRNKLVRVALICFVCWTFVHYGKIITKTPHHIFINDFHNQPCKIPVLNPFDPSIKSFIWKPEPITCAPFPSVVYVDENNILHVDASAFEYFDLKSDSDMSCTAESVLRATHDDNLVTFEDLRIVQFPATMKTEFSRIRCHSGNKIIFDNIVSGMEDRKGSNKAPAEDETDDQPSVMLFGIDSVSRSASIRGIPKTLEYLKSIGSYDFSGLMKIGDNTPPNLFGLLTGKKLYTKETPGFGGWMNDWPILWRNFSSKNYVTLYGEDVPESTFNLDFYKGFAEQPTDHYMRPFWMGKKKSEESIDEGLLRLLILQSNKLRTSDFCNQNTKKHNEVINYLKKFLKKYKTKRKFSLTFLTNIAHQNFNNLFHGDEDFRNFLKWLNDEGYLKRTIVFFFSDHGARFEEIRNTFVGRMESRMPMFHLLLPDILKRKYPDVHVNLKNNTKRLLSHFDTHQTLVDILNNNYARPTIQIVEGRKRGVSLFGKIPKSRSCMDAGIQSDYCACYQSTPINLTNNHELLQVGVGLVEHINNLLSSEHKCKTLKLSRIIGAETLSSGLKHNGTSYGHSILRFVKPEVARESLVIQIETEPGHARFEVSCEMDVGSHSCMVTNVDRTNAYGNQSYCVSQERLRQYCYC